MQSLEASKSLQIGSLKVNSIVSVAPMAGITDCVLRQLIRNFSKDSLLTTEMLSSEALMMNREQPLLNHEPFEHPLSFQISGHKPELMAKAAQKIEHMASVIDINMGCPAPKITSNGDGASLMKNMPLASKIIESVKNAVKVPVTVKCRLGWDVPNKNYIEFSKMVEDSGADAITIHGRTKTQMYSGVADWNAIGEVKSVLKIPVIGNGDITSVEKAIECLKISQCDGIAVGRGVLGDPELIHRIEHYLHTGEILPEPGIARRLELLRLHLSKEIEYRGEIHGIRFMRKFFAWYIRDIRGVSQFRFRLVRAENLNELNAIFEEIESHVR